MRYHREIKKPRRRFVRGLFPFLLLALLHANPGWTAEVSAAQEQNELPIVEYKIGPRDMLDIRVFELPELNQTL